MLDDDPQGEFDLVGYWRAIRRQKWGILGITLSCVIIGAMMALKAVPIYQATVTILAKPIQPRVTTTNQYANNALIFLFYETQYEIIKSRAVAARVVDKLGLATKEEARRARQQAESVAKEQSGLSLNWRSWVPDELSWLPDEWLGQHEPIALTAEQRREALISRLAGGLVVKGGDQSEIISIKYDSPDPEFAAEFVNAVADAYVAFGLHSRLTSARKTTSWLNDQITELKKKMEESEAALEVYQQSTGMVDTSSRQQVISTKLASLSVEQIKAQTAKSEAEIRYNQVLKIKQQGGGYGSLVSVLNSALVLGLNSKYSEMERRVSEYSDRYGHKHPKMIAAESDLKQADKALRSAINKVVESIRKEYDFAVAQERRVNALIKKQKREIGDVRGKGFALAKLEREVENNRQLYETFLGRFQEEDVVDEYDISNVRIIDRAIVPMTPIEPNIPRMRMISVVAGLVLGIMFAVVRERLDNTFKTLETLETKLGLPVLGLAPLLKKIQRSESAESYVSIAPRSPFAEALNHVRTSVLFSNIDQPPKVLLVTSATASEGKTTLSTNLAIAFSTLGRTLLVECDLRRPRFGGIFPREQQHGLTNLVSGQESLNACVFQNEEHSGELFVLGAGTVPPNPLEFLSSKSFAKALDILRKHYEHIVIDAPPVLPVSDAIVVASMVDGVILAVKAESTTYQMANTALRRLKAAQIQPLGSVLTMADASRMAYYGGQSYDYYDSGYYGYGES
ncbi:Tyrosine-protein kinase EpsD [hydrothermal vent metagenome]|uniref:non-specific protein-tyrosine kinase n=1 Tax=hydrothermal vent metagenome TaxID=652676 RepID=A0A3B1BAH0_9ZZZZ